VISKYGFKYMGLMEVDKADGAQDKDKKVNKISVKIHS